MVPGGSWYWKQTGKKKAAGKERNWRGRDEGRSVLNRASSTGPFDWHVWNINPGALQPWRTPYINLVNIQDKMHSSSSYLHSSLFFPLISAVEHFHDAAATEPSCIMYKKVDERRRCNHLHKIPSLWNSDRPPRRDGIHVAPLHSIYLMSLPVFWRQSLHFLQHVGSQPSPTWNL